MNIYKKKGGIPVACAIGFFLSPKTNTTPVYLINNSQELPSEISSFFTSFKTDENNTTFIFSKNIEKYLFFYEQGKKRSETTLSEGDKVFILGQKIDDMASFCLNNNHHETFLSTGKTIQDIIIWHFDSQTFSSLNRFKKTYQLYPS